MNWQRGVVCVVVLGTTFALGYVLGRYRDLPGSSRLEAAERVAGEASKELAIKGWKKGKGWGWIWGKEDEVGSLNAMTPETIRAALSLVKDGKVYDLGVPYDRTSFKWPGHSPGEILTFRSPEGVRRQGDFPAAIDSKANPAKVAWHSSALFINDNVATQ